MTNDDEVTPTGWGDMIPPQARTPTPTGARRVPPSESKPHLSPRSEAVLAVADAESAEGYDALEAAGDKVEALTRAIENGVVQVELVLDDSLVIKLDRLLK